MIQIRRWFRLFRCLWKPFVFSWLKRIGLEAATIVLLAASIAHGQVAAAVAAPQDLETALHQMSDRAGVIFVGQVTRVQRVDGEGVASGVVEIDFQVDQAIRGCTAGVSYRVREWAGLWEGSVQRYRVGQRLLMLLHAPGASGMSSPVDGMDGAIPIARGGSGLLAAGSSARMTPPAVDLRWVAVKMLHPVVYGREAGGEARRTASRAVDQTRVVRAGVGGGSSAVPVETILSAANKPGSASVPMQQAAVDVVVGMLALWQSEQQVQHAVR